MAVRGSVENSQLYARRKSAAMRVRDGVEERRCNQCGDWKVLSEFYSWERRDNRGHRWSPCKPCLDRLVRLAQEAKKSWVDQYKLERGCADCGYNENPAALDFDHLPGTVKTRDIKSGKQFGWKALFAEVAKCEVVCANCHRIRTVERRKGGDVQVILRVLGDR